MNENDKIAGVDAEDQQTIETIEDAEIIDDDNSSDDDVIEDAAADGEVMDDITEPETLPEPTPEPVQQSSGSGGFLMLLLGGVAAGAIGYGIAEYTNADTSAAQLQLQAEQIAALQDQLDSLPSTDLSDIESQIANVSTNIGATVDEATATLGAQMTALEDRIAAVERQPNADGTLSDTALAAYQSELDALRAELNDRQDAVMGAAAQAEADLAAARAEAERLEQEALAAAEAAQARAAINRIAAAVETGAPFADALADLDANIPTALTDAADTGVATTASLVADFPAAARSALAVARSEGVSDDAGGIGGFLRNQFDVRSTTPQEGPGPDAVLSRAEAAAKEGRVADALAEIEALPEVVRADLTDWTARAQQRADVLDALSDLSETYQ
ncbi:COG4223 family protein [Pseudooctadecabacter sp.]|uniref:COG4223 family protein n=1 Tax=Pseudooctadecabacter sp. TaxID=1966338 RepID=UPI0035C875E5